MNKFEKAAKEILSLGCYIKGVQNKECHIEKYFDNKNYINISYKDIVDILRKNEIKCIISWGDIELESTEDKSALIKAVMKFNHHKKLFIKDLDLLKSVLIYIEQDTDESDINAYKILVDLSNFNGKYDFSRKTQIREIFSHYQYLTKDMLKLSISLLVESMEIELQNNPIMQHKDEMEEQEFPTLPWKNLK